MAYTSDITNLLAKQLEKLTTLNRHQLAGQVANLDFWLSEVRHCLEVLDGYRHRFQQMHAAQTRYATEHGTTEFDLSDGEGHQRPAAAPRKVPGVELKEARRGLCDAASRFLVRCYKDGHISESALDDAASKLGIRVDLPDE